jgi:biopolymer transport protein ExbB
MKAALDFLTLGGPLVYVILAGSLLATAIFVERVLALQRRNVVPVRFAELSLSLIRDGKFDEARGLCASSDTPLANVVSAGLKRAGMPLARVREAIADRGRREAVELERFTGLLGTIATTMPLIGLLGTITGMIRTFQSVQGSIGEDQMNAGALANGIWEALITTAAGLCVAIPAFIAYRYLIGRIDRLIAELEEHALEVAELVAGDGEA